ncbi:MAG TPA: isoprenylcysteine carboxylmethyltransferase family protein, partial [Anaerolineales bacterium]|nr:isoprenylcysteine carboxylmethyltransferase family protein [Anaerolineales bacterium]
VLQRENMFWLIFFIAVWGILHSLLASLGIKAFLCRTLGNGFMKFYRLLYNIFAVISLAPVLYLMGSLPDETLYQIPAPWSYLMRAGQVISVLLLFAAALQTDLLAFAGLRQLFEEEKSGLVKNGLYRLVRHPLYTFSLLILWLSPSVTVNTFVVYVALTLYILIGVIFEERKLQREFGQEYAEYKSVTPMLIPGLKGSGNK